MPCLRWGADNLFQKSLILSTSEQDSISLAMCIGYETTYMIGKPAFILIAESSKQCLFESTL